MLNEIKNYTTEEKIKFSTQIINITGSSFSLIGLVLVLCIIKTKKNIKIFMNEMLLYIIISEMLNCFSKILEFFKFIQIIHFEFVSYVQLILSLYSDFCTLITSLVISFKLYDSLKKQSFYFKKKKIKKITRFICFGLPFIFSILIFYLDTFVIKSYKESKYFYWVWVAPILSIIIYLLFFLIIFFIVYISFLTISFLKEKQKEIIEQNTNSDEDEDGKENKDTQEKETKDTPKEEENKNVNTDKGETKKVSTVHGFNESLISEKINKILKKIYKYPLVTSVLWILLGTYRVTESIYLLRHKNYDIVVYILMILHSFISSFRGVINFIVFFIFQIISKNDFLELFKCKKEDESQLTPAISKMTQNFEE